MARKKNDVSSYCKAWFLFEVLSQSTHRSRSPDPLRKGLALGLSTLGFVVLSPRCTRDPDSLQLTIYFMYATCTAKECVYTDSHPDTCWEEVLFNTFYKQVLHRASLVCRC